MYRSQSLEISKQILANPIMAEETLAESRPLHELADHAPTLPSRGYDLSEVYYPFSNDEAIAPYLAQLQARTQTAEYQAASNRVAVLVGESSLATNLKHIPEDTIILLDNSVDMCLFMANYIAGLRTSNTTLEWLQAMDLAEPRLDDKNMYRFSALQDLTKQTYEYMSAGSAHIFTDDAEFLASKAIVQKK